MGRAINKSVTIVELIKRRIVGLHQITSIQSTDITDTWEPLEKGLQTLETTRKVSMITIKLSKKVLDTTNIGYQLPIPADQVKVLTELEYEGGGMDLWLLKEEVEVAEDEGGQEPHLRSDEATGGRFGKDVEEMTKDILGGREILGSVNDRFVLDGREKLKEQYNLCG
ncbi:ribonuclease P subunit p25 [Olea europaea subsp. europaea]|uniref:Ribonuclease P subunit p25 n=1 Tax=Olea europaea subsp. europaea TaxID=158383 RepID=A0A8S0R9S8_OLEEU|nr:ribonuclease P subunit p25 [Olea europaea subsp. europaea]